jgi:hypothetical protein
MGGRPRGGVCFRLVSQWVRQKLTDRVSYLAHESDGRIYQADFRDGGARVRDSANVCQEVEPPRNVPLSERVRCYGKTGFGFTTGKSQF